MYIKHMKCCKILLNRIRQFCWCPQRCCGIIKCKVWCRCNTVSFLQNHHYKDPITHLLGWDMGCLLWCQILIYILTQLPQWCLQYHVPDSKDHEANMGPTWVLSAPGGPHVGPMNLVIRGYIGVCYHGLHCNYFHRYSIYLLLHHYYDALCVFGNLKVV